MSSLKEPGVLADHWPWGPARAVVVIPKRFNLVCDLTFCVVRSGGDFAGRSYKELHGDATWDILTRDEAARIFADNMLPPDVHARAAQPPSSDVRRRVAGRERVRASSAQRASARIASLRRLGFNRMKSRAMIELARGVAGGRLDLERVAVLDDDAAVGALCALRGVERWTAEYVLLRGLGLLQVFPGDDIGAQNALRFWLGRAGLSGYDAVERALARWRPWAGVIYFHLLLAGLAEAGQVT